MKNRFLRGTAALVSAVILAFSFAGCKGSKETQYPSPTERFFVNDFANVMTEADINTVYTKGAALNEQTTAQAVVVTVENLGGKEAADYALELGRQWGVGDSDKNNGAVVLLSVDDREIYIAVGYGLEGALPDSKTGRIIDIYGIPYFSGDEFSAGLVNIYNAVVNEIYIEYGITPDENYTPIALVPQTETSEQETPFLKVAISWLVLIAVVALYVAVFGRRGGLFIFGSPRFFGENFNNHGGFGGSSGGFGGFKGGGGSFGGGGAGRRF